MSEQNVQVKKQNIKQSYELLLKKYDKKSPIIRELHSQGYDRTQIKNVMNIRYQHVRNVLITPLTSNKKV